VLRIVAFFRPYRVAVVFVIVAILGPGLVNAMISVAVTYLPQFTRLTRASVITEPRVLASP